MAFISMMFLSLALLLLLGMAVIGLVVTVLGIVFLAVHLSRRKTKPGKGFRNASILCLCIGIPMLMTVAALAIPHTGFYISDTETESAVLYVSEG